MKKLIIYDSLCIYCRNFIKILRELNKNKFTFLEYKSDEAQEILNVQFKEIGFTLYLFDRNYVYYGEYAIKRISKIVGMPKIIQEFSFSFHPYIVGGVGLLTSRKQKVSEPKGNRKIKEKVKVLIKKL